MKSRVLKVMKWTVSSLLCIFLLTSIIIYFNKDKICNAVIQELNTYLKVPVDISEVDLTFWSTFPNVSIDFKDVFIRDSYDNSTKYDTLLSVKELSFYFNPLDIWNEKYNVKSIKINNGSIKLKTNNKGLDNYDIYKSKSKSKNEEPFNLNLRSILFSNVRFSYANAQTHQKYQSTLRDFELKGSFNEKNYKIDLKGDLLINHLKSGNVNLINNQEVFINSFINVDNTKGNISIPSSVIKISKMPFIVSGEIHENAYSFHVKAKKIKFKQLISSFNHQILKDASSLKAKGDVFFDLSIKKDTLKSSLPKVYCDFGIKNASLIDPVKKTNISNLSINGKYYNKNKKEEGLYIDKIECVTQSGPFNAQLNITDFDAPHVVGKAKGKINLKSFIYIFPFDYIDNISGELSAKSNFDFIVKFDESNQKTVHLNKLNGLCKLNKVNLKLKSDYRIYKNISGSIFLNKNKLNFSKIYCELGKSKISVDGEINNFQDYLTSNKSLLMDLAIKGEINTNDVFEKSSSDDLINLERSYVLSDFIKGNLVFEFKSFIHEGHQFKNSKGNVNIKGRKISISKFSTSNASSKIRGNIFINERLPELFDITCNLATDKLNIKNALKEWDNFHQTTIYPSNIEGDINGEIQMFIPYDLRKGILMSGLDSKIDLTLTKGRLLKVKSLEDLAKSFNSTSGKLIFGKKNIAHIQKELQDLNFLKLKNTILIKNSKVTIPSMMISSSYLNMTVGGIHDFDNNIDYRFSFKFKDLLKTKKEDQFGEIIDDKTGVHLFIRMRGTLDNPIIEWDKESKKKQIKKKIEKEKNDTKAILKSEFGLFKNDENVKVYIPEETPKEHFEVDFSEDEVEEELLEIKSKKINNLKNKLNKFKNKLKQNDAEEEFDID